MSDRDEARRVVLSRRARFLGAALAGIAGCGPARGPDAPVVVPVASTNPPTEELPAQPMRADRDKDGVPDDDDLCPNDPEDIDGFEDGDGCPDPDNDKDGIPDVADACPNEPGKPSPNPSLNGCPQFGAIPRVCLSIIVIREVTFASGSAQIQPTGTRFIDTIVQQLSANPQLTVELEGHVDGSEPPTLGQTRADAVKKVLVSRGIAASRITTSNAAGTRPIDPNPTGERNRRVEFNVR